MKSIFASLMAILSASVLAQASTGYGGGSFASEAIPVVVKSGLSQDTIYGAYERCLGTGEEALMPKIYRLVYGESPKDEGSTSVSNPFNIRIGNIASAHPQVRFNSPIVGVISVHYLILYPGGDRTLIDLQSIPRHGQSTMVSLELGNIMGDLRDDSTFDSWGNLIQAKSRMYNPGLRIPSQTELVNADTGRKIKTIDLTDYRNCMLRYLQQGN